MMRLLLVIAMAAALAAPAGPAYAAGPPREHGGQSPEFSRIMDRGALVRDARAASPLRDWNSLAFDLTTDVGRAGRAVRLSVASVPASPSEAGDAAWIQVPPDALRRALLAILDRGPTELAARRPRRFALRDGVCGRYAITLWDVGREAPTLIDDAYLTPLEADSVARDVADALSHSAPAAARAMRVQLGIAGPRPRPAPLATLAGVDTASPDPVAIQLAPSEGDEFLRTVVYRLAGVPDSLLEQRFGRAINRADGELSSVGGWMARSVSRATMHALATVLARAAVADSTGLDAMTQYPAWPATWRATAVDATAGGLLAARAPRTLSTRRIRGRALEWSEHLPRDAEDDTRRVLTDLVELGLPPAREVRGVGEDPPAPALPSPAEERESLLVAARTGAGTPGAAFLGLSFWFHGGEPHHFTESTRLVAGDRAAAPPGGPSGEMTPIAEASLRALLQETLDNPDVLAGAHSAYGDAARGDPFLEIRVVERRHGGNPTRLLWVSFLDRASGARAVELLARALDGAEPDVAAELRRQGQVLRSAEPPAVHNHGGS